MTIGVWITQVNSQPVDPIPAITGRQSLQGASPAEEVYNTKHSIRYVLATKKSDLRHINYISNYIHDRAMDPRSNIFTLISV